MVYSSQLGKIGPDNIFGERISAPIRKLVTELNSQKNKLLKPLGITLSQYSILAPLHISPHTGAQLARYCFITPQGVTKILNVLEDKKFITRRTSPDHMQVNLIELTDKGREIFQLADEKIVELERVLSSQITPEENQFLHMILGKIEHALKN